MKGGTGSAGMARNRCHDCAGPAAIRYRRTLGEWKPQQAEYGTSERAGSLEKPEN